MTESDSGREPAGVGWPTVAFAAKVAADSRTHLVVAPADAVADRAAQTTRCRLPAVELSSRPRDITCSRCAAVSGIRSAADFPPERVT